MQSLFSKKLNQKELDAIEQANAILCNAKSEMNQLFKSLMNDIPWSTVTYEIIKLNDGIGSVNRASEILMEYAKLFNETKKSSEND